MKLDDGVALITGGSRGIGLAIAEALAREGMRIAICARSADGLQKAESRLNSIGHGALILQADVSDAAQVEQLVEQVNTKYQGIDLLVNNAGIGRWGTVEEFEEGDWDAVLDVNLKGVFLCSQAVFPPMRERGGGYIINIASYSGKQGMAGLGAYCASKFGVVGFTETLIREGKPHNIRATAICPGLVATEMTAGSSVPPDEMMRPDDIAKTVLYLLSLSDVTSVQEVVLRRQGSIET